MNWLEVSLTVDGELAEAVADVFARFAPNGVMTEQGVKFTDEEDAGTPTGPITVRAYLEVNDQLEDARQKLEESLYYLGMIQPLPTPVYKQIADQNWMEAWKQHYKPILIGQRLLILPAWMESPEPRSDPHQDRPRHGVWNRHASNDAIVFGVDGESFEHGKCEMVKNSA